MSLDRTGCNWHMSGSKDGEARHAPLGQHASTKRRNAWWHTQKAGEHAPDGRTPATQTGSQKAPAVAHDRRHGRTQRATTAATLHQTPHQRRRQGDRREEQQVTEAAHKEQHRRLHRQAKAHLDGLPEAWPPTLTERLKRPPAPTGAKRPTKPREARRARKRPRISRTQGVVGSKPLGGGGLQAPKIPENPVDFR
jgi:hypothetical protein